MKRKETPVLNAGSMADIAFLLLIFFLVTTTLKTDQGIMVKLPRKDERNNKITVKDKNILHVVINNQNQLMVENQQIDISQLTAIAKEFIDNGGGKDVNGNFCDWCLGTRDPKSSDHPSKAVIVIESNRSAHYETYIRVIDHLNLAYAELRNRYANTMYQMTYSDLVEKEKKDAKENVSLREKILAIQKKYPLLISDSQLQN